MITFWATQQRITFLFKEKFIEFLPQGMEHTRAYHIYQKEIKSYFYSLSSYIFIIVFLSLSTWIFFENLFLARQTSMRIFFELMPWFFLFLVPSLTMKIWAEEKRQGTDETLLVLPIPEWHIVLAKFLAGATFLGIVLLFSLPIPMTLSRLGDLDWGPVFGSYIGAWFLGGSFIAIGQCLSACTKNQIVAFLFTFLGIAFFIILGLPLILTYVGIFGNALNAVSVFTHYQNFTKGLIYLRDIYYYCSLIIFFLVLNSYVLKRRHWK